MNTFFTLVAILFLTFLGKAQVGSNQIIVTDEMFNTMWRGELNAKIKIDTIKPRNGLYGLGPMAMLQGEILILNGTCYSAMVLDETHMQIDSHGVVGAPFFAHGFVQQWKAVKLPGSVKTHIALEKFLDKRFKKQKGAKFFKIEGRIEEATIHLVNLPLGTPVKQPKDAHKGKTTYKVYDKEVELLGFYSSEHRQIFTHHDTNLHMHLITKDRSKMGHVDSIQFIPKKAVIYFAQ
jgi:acetolactate decarboxylase